jgi:hypothetical protein
MAFVRKNLLIRILKVQNTYCYWQGVGLSNEAIYRTHILPVYMICRKTFYSYLTVPARKQLKEMEPDINLEDYVTYTLSTNKATA